MARMPKATPAPVPLPPPAPLPRGRRPKASAKPETTVAAETGAVKAGADLLASPAAPGAVGSSARGRKPKQRGAADAPTPIQQALEQQPEPDTDNPNTAAEPAAGQDDALIAEMAYPVSAGDGGTAAASDAAPPSHDEAPAKAAAQWDRATDTVRFEWAEIERTASQDGPNQVMAKLLVAARAEGANSRWPL